MIKEPCQFCFVETGYVSRRLGNYHGRNENNGDFGKTNVSTTKGEGLFQQPANGFHFSVHYMAIGRNTRKLPGLLHHSNICYIHQ